MKVFLSAVSKQFIACRNALASDLRAIGCEVKVQEDFRQGVGSLIAQIESYVAQCNRVIAIVGTAYGADASSDAIPVGKPQRSYTHWEYYFAVGERLHGSTTAAKDLFVYFASEKYLHEFPVDQSEEEKDLQQTFVKGIKQSGKHHGMFESLDNLCRLVLRDGWQMQDRPFVHRPPFQLPKRSFPRKFFGRQLLLKELETRLRNREDTDIWGPAGMGKTALAAEALFNILDTDPANLATSPYPDGIVFIDLYSLKFDSPENAWNHLVNAFDPSSPQNMPTKDRARLACNGRRALVIVEGAEEANDCGSLQDLLNVLSSETVRLVLTRNKNQARTAKPLNVEAQLERDDALDLIREIWQEHRNESLVGNLYERLGGHPLALTWAASQLNADEESPQAFMQALSSETLPSLNERSNENHTLEWLFTRSTKHLPDAANRVLSAAGMLAQLPLPLSVAVALLSDEPTAREMLKLLVRYGLLRVSDSNDEQWEFTHALTHQFANCQRDEALFCTLQQWAIDDFDRSIGLARTFENFQPLLKALSHCGALLRADKRAEHLHSLAETIRYQGNEVLRKLGRLDLVREVNTLDHFWLDSVDDRKKKTPEWQRELSVNYSNLGHVDWTTGDLQAAHTAFEKSLKICGHLAYGDPGNEEWSWRLSRLYWQLGDVALSSGNLEYAEAVYLISTGALERLIEANPNFSLYLEELSVSYEKLGDSEDVNRNLKSARAYYEKSMKIRNQLVAADPTDLKWQMNLGIIYERLGYVAMLLGETNVARQYYETRLTLTQRIAAARSSDLETQRELSVSYQNIGTLLLNSNRNSDARPYLERSLEISNRLAIADPNNAIWNKDLEWAKNQISKLES